MSSRKIYCEVRSGLGNQLFQFAFAYSLGREFNRSVVLCPSFYDAGWKRAVKRILGKEVRSFRLPKILKDPFMIIDQETLNVEVAQGKILVYKEGEVDEQMIRGTLGQDVDVLLKGYWQNPALFLPIQEPLSNMVEPTFKLSDKCRNMLDRIKETYVGIHVRRGDFLTNRSFGACTIEYYNTAMLRASEFVSTPRFIIFTNDKAWVNRNFSKQFSYEIYSNLRNSNTDIEELYLMTRFKTFVISNSTFSWWGAYLNPTKDKTIVSPRNWFLKKELQSNAGNFISEDWIALDNHLELKN